MKFAIPSVSEVRHRLKEPLYKNSFFLLLNSGTSSILGFVFWILAARFYSPSQVGVISALVAAIMLLATFSRLGFDMGVIRFLSTTEDKAGMINACLTITGLASLTLSVIYVAGLDFWSPALSFIHTDMLFLVSFIVFTVVFALTTMLNPVFIAFRRAEFSLYQNIVGGVSKVILPVLMVFAGTIGLLFSWGVGLCLAVALSLFLFLPRLEPGYRPLPRIKKNIVRDMLHFSFMNYVSGVLHGVPMYILPLLVINILGAETTAYFRIAWAISSFLFFVIPTTVCTSLFAEGSYNRGELRRNTVRAASLMLVLIIPGMALLLIFGDKILLLFGAAYSENGLAVLRVLVLSGVPVILTRLYISIRTVQMRMKSVILVVALNAVLVLGLIYALITPFGLIGVGIGWTVTQTVVAVLVGATILIQRRGRSRLAAP